MHPEKERQGIRIKCLRTIFAGIDKIVKTNGCVAVSLISGMKYETTRPYWEILITEDYDQIEESIKDYINRNYPEWRYQKNE